MKLKIGGKPRTRCPQANNAPIVQISRGTIASQSIQQPGSKNEQSLTHLKHNTFVSGPTDVRGRAEAAGGGARRGKLTEPLYSADWFRRIEKIASGELGSVEKALRHASHLLQLTPAPFRHVVKLAIDEECFEELLEAGELDAAARYLIAQPAALTVTDDADGGGIRATISCVILNRAISGMGESVATAILAAWTKCLLALRTEYGANLSGPDRFDHKFLSGRDRRSL